MRGVVVITGVMAAGKSTVAQTLAERLPRAAHVRGDVFRRMIVSGREEFIPGAEAGGAAEAQLRLRYRLSAATADAYAEAGFTAVVQDVLLGPDLAAYVELVRTRPLYVVVLAPSAETVAVREAGRAKTGYGPAGESATQRAANRAANGGANRASTPAGRPEAGESWSIEALDEVLRASTPRIGLWLDTSTLTAAETVDAIVAGRERARVV
ncbi:AAA family ATPase [Streptomyces sp. NBC_00076]|uniref:AAA family ATPase n=1 Tax=Streptomyces sp. NBC_00076 TaxID=2975642 RepID=UPI003244ACF5